MIPPFLTQALAPDRWPALALIMARISGLMLAAPLWSMTGLPKAARAAITVVLAVLLLPACPAVPNAEHVLDLPVPIAMELVIGIVIGLTAAVFVQGVALAGEVISIQMGLTLGPVLAPTPDVQVSGIGQLQTMLALLVYVSVGGHLALVRALADSLQTLPPGQPLALAQGGQSAVLLAGALYSSAIRAAAPVMVTLLLVNVAMAIVHRAVPQINTMMVAFPITISVGLIMIGASLPLVAGAISGWMSDLPGLAAGALQSFQPVR